MYKLDRNALTLSSNAQKCIWRSLAYYYIFLTDHFATLSFKKLLCVTDI